MRGLHTVLKLVFLSYAVFVPVPAMTEYGLFAFLHLVLGKPNQILYHNYQKDYDHCYESKSYNLIYMQNAVVDYMQFFLQEFLHNLVLTKYKL